MSGKAKATIPTNSHKRNQPQLNFFGFRSWVMLGLRLINPSFDNMRIDGCIKNPYLANIYFLSR